jgi:flavin reductase (DIM6/NTAB) family NADH-FMN oxidoreductase RutF
MEKIGVKIHEYRWFREHVPVPFPVAIVTTVDENGVVNAAPFARIFPWSDNVNKPQLSLSIAPMWHTASNIRKTKEFVANWPSIDILKEVMICATNYPRGVNELEEAGLHQIPSNKVKPPRIKECLAHYECRLNKIIDHHFIADVVDISISPEFAKMSREEKIRRIPIAYGAPIAKPYYYFGTEPKVVRLDWPGVEEEKLRALFKRMGFLIEKETGEP